MKITLSGGDHPQEIEEYVLKDRNIDDMIYLLKLVKRRAGHQWGFTKEQLKQIKIITNE